MPKKIAIFGTGRNGSTLLLRLLDGIPGAFTYPVELNFLSSFDDLAHYGRVRWKTGANATTAPLNYLNKKISGDFLLKNFNHQIQELETLYKNQFNKNLDCSWALDAIRAKAQYLPGEFVEDFLQAQALCVGKGDAGTIIFKSTETPYAGYYEQLFPEMRFVHIIRNPVDMYSSQKRTLMVKKKLPSWYLGGDNLFTMIDKRWIPHVQAVLKSANSGKHIFVRYEDLLEDSSGTIGKICEWAGLPLPQEPAKQSIFGELINESLAGNPSQAGVKTPLEVEQSLNKKYNYEAVLTPRETDLIIYKTADLGRKIGYFDQVKRPNGLVLLAKWLLPDKWEFRYGWSSAKYSILTCFAFFFRRRQLIYSLFKKT